MIFGEFLMCLPKFSKQGFNLMMVCDDSSTESPVDHLKG